MHVNRRVALLLAAIFCVAGTVSAVEGAKRIGVVNVSRVFQASQKVQQIQKRLKEQFESKRLELEKKQRELEQDMVTVKREQAEMAREAASMQKQRTLFNKVQDLQAREFELKLQIREVGKTVEQVRMEEMKQVLKEIRAAIRDVGVAERLDLILRAPEYDEEGLPAVAGEDEAEQLKRAPKTASELVRRFRENPVLYFASGVDITEQVITKLNADFAKTGGATKKAP
jgi:Skp family chaperone for outer membrane proteins